MPTDYSKEDYLKISQRLTGYGAQIAKFHQGSFQQKALNKTNQPITHYGGESLGAGYCAGVSLDWIRRVLLGGEKAKDAEYLSYKFGQLDSSNSTPELKHKTFGNVQRMANAWQASNSLNFSSSGGKPFRVKSSTWEQAASELDKNFNQYRQGDQRGTTDKPFSSLGLVSSKMHTYGNAGDIEHELFRDKGFMAPPGGAMQLGFNGASGHAVAVWRRRKGTDQNDSFYFFDPNYGVFSYKLDGLKSAIRMLFLYFNGDTPRYANCGRLTNPEMNFKLFGPPNRMDAEVKQLVTNQPKAQITAPKKDTVTLPRHASHGVPSVLRTNK